jgi:carbon storage regulator
MLVVTRRKGQKIVIGSDIEVVVSGISGSTVRLAVVAPRSVPVLRGEVYDAVLEQNRAAALTELGEDFEIFVDMAPAPEEEGAVSPLSPTGVILPTRGGSP